MQGSEVRMDLISPQRRYEMDGEFEIKKAYASILESDFERAIDWFERAVRLDPDNAAYHYKLSVTYARSNKLTRAIEHARSAMKLEPGNDAYKFHADALEAKQLMQGAEKHINGKTEPHIAVEMLKRAILLDPLLIEAFLLLAVAYGELDEFGFALQSAQNAVKLDPQHAEANRLVEEFKYKLKRYLRS
jgi:tetratricopeptide (TPR) repeat protein